MDYNYKNITEALFEDIIIEGEQISTEEAPDPEWVDIDNAAGNTIISYQTLRHFFDKCIQSNNGKDLTTVNKDIYNNIWSKIKDIADHQRGGQYAQVKDEDWNLKVQYSYNAHIVENYLANIFGWQYVTSAEDHDNFHTPKAIASLSEPDFGNIDYDLGGMRVSGDRTIEIKNYGSAAEALKYLNGEDRSTFHNATFILVFIMGSKKWYLRKNAISQNNKVGLEISDLGVPEGLINLKDKNEAGIPIVTMWK